MRCGGCGQENPERAKFCLECGAALVAAPAAPSHESRRIVTVVFADMVGFTSLGESLDQESLRRVMDRFYGEMRSAIEAQEGTLAKFIGDAVLAVWGTPHVREDDALRAVRAADAMRSALAGLNEDLEQRWGVRVGMRTGVNTGEVVVDPTRPADLLVGDTLNVAARLEQAAADGEVLVGPDTYRLVRDDVALEPVAPLALKGKTKPMPAWRVVDAVERRREERLQAPLVGRDAELQVLEGAFAAVVETRACRLTTVIGSPGLGKTRLVADFVESLAGRATVLHGRCQATGEGITFQPVAEVLRAAAGIDDDETPEAARAKLAAVMPADDADRDRVVERAAGLLGLGPVASTEETFWAVRRILEALARERPVVVVHDDIHWGQPTFLDLLEHFVEWIRHAPVLVLALARPELREVRPELAEHGELTQAIALAPLGPDASRAMVSGLLGPADLPEGLARRVLETTEGNPLFLGETLRMLADEGVLRREGHTWVAGDSSDVTVPPTINALLSARIERLPRDERSVVERAAVIGHSFYRGAVTELSPATVRPHVDGALETLRRKEMVRREDEWWLDEQVFRFHHVLIRDAAYRSLLKEARAELHERFADWLEAKAGELAGEHEEVIAFHLEQAHAYRVELGSLDEAGRSLAARAGRRLHSAGCRALSREDLPAAINLLRRALVPLDEDAAVRMEVLVDLAEALVSAGDTQGAEEVVEELGLGADELSDARLRARAVVFAAQLDNLTGAGQVRQTADAAAGAAEVLARAGDRAGEAKAHQVIAQSEALLGQVAAAEAALDRALVAARAADDRRRITAVLSGAPRAALWGPAPIVRAAGRCLDVVRILRMTAGNRHVEAAALRSQAVLEAMRGRADAARGILATCRTTLEELGLALELHETAVHAGIVELLSGDPAAAERCLRSAQDGFAALGIEGGAAQAAALLARALLEQGRDADALEATRLAEQHGGEDLKTTATWLGVRAEALARRGEHDEALALAQRGVELTEPTDALADKADALMALAAVHAAAGVFDAARAAATRARELYAAKDHATGVARAAAVVGDDRSARIEGASRAAQAEAAPAGLARGSGTVEANELHPTEEFTRRAPAGDDGSHRWAAIHDEHVRRSAEIFTPSTVDAAVGEMYSRQLRFHDHRGVALMGELDFAGYREQLRSMAAALELDSAVLEVVEEQGPLRFARSTLRGTVDDSPLEVGSWYVTEVDAGGQVAVSHIFDEEGPAREWWEHELGLREALKAYNAHDFEHVRALLHDDFAQQDRRPGGIAPPRGPDAFVNTFREMVAMVPDIRLEGELLAVRGNARAMRYRWYGRLDAGGGEMEVEFFPVSVMVDGQTWRSYLHATPEEAVASLAEVASALDAPPGTPVSALGASERFVDAFNRRDWDALRDVFAEGFRQADHRTLGWEDWNGPDAVVAQMRSVVDVAPDVRFALPELLARHSRAALVRMTVRGGGGDAAFEVELLNVFAVDAHGRQVLSELFAPEAEEEARGRLADVGTALSEHASVVAEAATRRDWEALRAACAEDLVMIDHRLVACEDHVGADAFVRFHRSLAAGVEGLLHAAEVHEHRGGLALLTMRSSGRAEPGGVEWLAVTEQVMRIRDGLLSEVHLFDDPTEARRHFEKLAEQDTDPRMQRFPELFNARDWRAVADFFDAGWVQVDHRPVGTAQFDRAQAVASWQEVVALAPDVRAELRPWWSTPEVTVGLVIFRGTRDGGPFENRNVLLAVWRDGRVVASEVFSDSTPRSEVRARFEEVAQRERRGPHDAHCGAAEAAYEGMTAACNRRDWEALAAFVAADMRWSDHRPGLRDEARDRESFVEVCRNFVGSTDVRWTHTTLEASGPHLLSRVSYTGTYRGGPFEVIAYDVITAGPDGRLAALDLYAEDQLDRARAAYAERTAEPARAAEGG